MKVLEFDGFRYFEPYLGFDFVRSRLFYQSVSHIYIYFFAILYCYIVMYSTLHLHMYCVSGLINHLNVLTAIFLFHIHCQHKNFSPKCNQIQTFRWRGLVVTLV